MTDPTAAGRALGSRYLLVDRLGQGASGEVWRAWDRQAGRHVAAKLLWPQHAADPEILTRFVNERSVLLGLDHPSIVRVRDFVAEGQDLAIVMDLIEGPSVASLLERHGTLPASQAVPLVAAVLDALDCAHGRGVTHRDVKPDNILLAGPGDPGPADVRLADFGIAGIVLDEARPATELIGTPSYMPPELVSYGKSGPASDVYAVGVVLYELLAGRTPFAGPGTNVTVAMRQVSSAPPRLPVPAPLWRTLDGMLAKDPAHRMSAAATAAALRALPPAALPDEALPTQPRPEEWADSASVLPSKRTVEHALSGGGPTAGPGLVPGPGSAGTDLAADPTADPASTSLRAVRPVGRPAPPAVAGLEREDPSGGTMTKAAARPAPLVTPRRPPRAGLPTRARVLIVAGAALGLAALGLLLWKAGVFTTSPDDEAEVQVTTVAAHVNGTSLPTGLRIDLDASYDTVTRLTDLTVTLSAAPRAPLRGDVLLVTPGLDGRGCAAVTEESGAVERVTASRDGLQIDCGYRLLGLELAAGQSTTVTLAADLDLVDDEGEVLESYGGWLADVQRATDDALSTVTGTTLALQRVDRITVEPTEVTLSWSSTPVPYRVVAGWASGGPDEGTELFTGDTVDGMEVDLLLRLTGDEGLDAVTVTTCNAAQMLGIRVLAEQPESGCHVEVGIGALDTGETPFAIRMR